MMHRKAFRFGRAAKPEVEQRNNQIRKLLLEGHAQCDVARTVGATRNAVAGVALRLRERGVLQTKREPGVPDRASDEALLRAMARRAAGEKWSSKQSVAMREVVAADLVESGEAPTVVMAGYPWVRR